MEDDQIHKPTRVLGIDVGNVRVGIAVSDSGLTVATPHSIIKSNEALKIIKLVTLDYSINSVVVGIPVHNANSLNSVSPNLLKRIFRGGLSQNSNELADLRAFVDASKQSRKDLITEIFKLSIDMVEILGLDVAFYDEKFTSKIVKDVARLHNINEKRQKGKVDDLAATVMLQSWLDSRKLHS